MTKLEIVLDDETSRLLESVAAAHGGDKNTAIREALQLRGTLEALLDELEDAHGASLREQKERSVEDFREGRFSSWEEVKRRNRL